MKNRKMKNWIILVVVWGSITNLYAQQGVTYNQYGSNQVALNPAASHVREGGEAFFLGRRQWVGMEGAPTLFWGNVYLPLGEKKAKVGLNLRHESMAVERSSEVSAFFSQSVRLSEVEYLAVSINAGVSYYDGRFSGIDPSDPAFGNADVRETDVLTGFGVMLYRPEYYYVGLSLPRLMFSNLGLGGDKQYSFRNQYHLSAGALFELSPGFHIRPGLLVTYAENLRPQADVSSMFFIQRTVGLGLNYRSYGDLSGMLQINVSRVGVGYSYQFNTNNAPLNRRINNSTHEIGLSYRFGNTKFGLL